MTSSIPPVPGQDWRSAFRQMLQEVENETDRDSAIPIEDVLEEVDKIIAGNRQ